MAGAIQEAELSRSGSLEFGTPSEYKPIRANYTTSAMQSGVIVNGNVIVRVVEYGKRKSNVSLRFQVVENGAPTEDEVIKNPGTGRLYECRKGDDSFVYGLRIRHRPGLGNSVRVQFGDYHSIMRVVPPAK